MEFTMHKTDLKTIMQKLGPIAKSSDPGRPLFQNIRFHLTLCTEKSGVLTATVCNGFIMSSLRFPISDCTFDNPTDLFVPPFTIPAQPRSSYDGLPVTFDDKSIDFNYIDSHMVQRLYKPMDEKPFEWSAMLPKGEPSFTIGLNPKLVIDVLKTFINSKNRPVRANYYDNPLTPVVLTQGDDNISLLCPVRIRPEDLTQNNKYIDEMKNHVE